MSPSPNRSDGWTVMKGLAMAVAVLAMAGFGLCTLCGFALTVEDLGNGPRGGIWQLALVCSAVGALITFVLFLAVRGLVRSVRPKTPPHD
jgi:hypothetical protein